MKRKILLIAAIAATIILSSCGMKVEEIDPALTNLTSAYQGGAYEQAETLVKDLKKAYRKMSDEQKSKFDELKSEVEYAISTVDEIYNDFNDAQDLYLELSSQMQRYIKINFKRRFPVQAFAWTLI